MSGLAGKRVIVTGGSAGIGLATAQAFIAAGAKVAIIARGKDRLDAAVASLGGNAFGIQGDTNNLESLPGILADAVSKLGGIDVLVNNNGAGEPQSADPLDIGVWQHFMTMHVHAPLVLIREALPELKKNKGVIVNVSSVLGRSNSALTAAYGVAKAGQDALTKNLAITLAPDGVRVCGVAPGSIRTPGLEAYLGGMVLAAMGKDPATATPEEKATAVEKSMEGAAKFHPLNRVGKPEEVASAIVFLASNQFITGDILLVDGGWSTTSWFNHPATHAN